MPVYNFALAPPPQPWLKHECVGKDRPTCNCLILLSSLGSVLCTHSSEEHSVKCDEISPGSLSMLLPVTFSMLNWTCAFISNEWIWKCFHRMQNAAFHSPRCNPSSNYSQQGKGTSYLHWIQFLEALFFICIKWKIILLYSLAIAFFHFSWICLRLQEEMSFHMRKLPKSSILIRS